MPQPTQIQFRNVKVERELASRIRPGESLGVQAAGDLERHYALLAAELATIPLSRDEAALACDALNGTLLEPHTMRLLWAEIEDSLRDGLAEKWQVDGPALVSKLRGLTPGQSYALYDAVQRYWRDTSERSLEAQLAAVGLVR